MNKMRVKVIKEGEQGFKFFIIAKGIVKIYSDSASKTYFFSFFNNFTIFSLKASADIVQ